MMKRFVVGLAAASIVATVAEVLISAAPSHQAQSVCKLPDRGAFSQGALVKYKDEIYRCLYVFNDAMAPTGVAWIKGEMVGSDFIPK